MCVSYSIAASCQAADYCMGCHQTTANSCTSCFNWGSGKVGARGRATANALDNCQAAQPTVLTTANCKFYSGSALTTTTAKSSGNCSFCSKKYRVWTVATSAETCTDTAASGCTAVANAEFTTCYVDTTTSSGAGACKKGHYPSGTVTNAGFPTCTKGEVANCDYASGSATCSVCKSGYAVNTSSTCTAFTTDKNCSSLFADSTCSTCWPAYYWNVSTCKLASSLISVSFLALAALFN